MIVREFLPGLPDLMGFGPLPPEHIVDWTLQIDVEGRPPARRPGAFGLADILVPVAHPA